MDSAAYTKGNSAVKFHSGRFSAPSWYLVYDEVIRNALPPAAVLSAMQTTHYWPGEMTGERPPRAPVVR